MPRWRLSGDGHQGLHLERAPATRRFGEERFTWVDLFYSHLADVRVYVLYFPSRFGLPLDETCMNLLHTFGDNTPDSTSINFWDPRDEHFAEALRLFDLPAPPAVVLASGLEKSRDGLLDERNVYCITFTDNAVLTDPDHFVVAVNIAHEVLTKGDPNQIARLIRARDREGLIRAMGRIATAVTDQVVKLKPQLAVPGGLSISLGGR